MRATLSIFLTLTMLAAAHAMEQKRQPPGPEPGYLGVMVQPVDEMVARACGLERAQGVLVRRVMDDSPAQRGGLLEDDVIVGFDGTAIADMHDFIATVAATRPGTLVQVMVIRDRQELVVPVTIGRRPANFLRR